MILILIIFGVIIEILKGVEIYFYMCIFFIVVIFLVFYCFWIIIYNFMYFVLFNFVFCLESLMRKIICN